MLACGTRVPEFLGRKNPQHAFLRKGSNAEDLRDVTEPCDYMEVGSQANFVGHFSPDFFLR
jgi:hypothetical protein